MNVVISVRLLLAGMTCLIVLNYLIFSELIEKPSSQETTNARIQEKEAELREIAVEVIERQLAKREQQFVQDERTWKALEKGMEDKLRQCESSLRDSEAALWNLERENKERGNDAESARVQ